MRKQDIIRDVYALIESDFSPLLTYHGMHHTRDVHEVCKGYIAYYGINGIKSELLEIGAIAHDIGFIHTYKDHEDMSAKMIGKIMEDYQYTNEQIETVKEMVMSTKVPQKPKNFLGEIICDADLDYLGRPDFPVISRTLYEEWKNYDIFENLEENFNSIQINFLKNHKFHTDFAKKHRRPAMLEHLAKLEKTEAKKKTKSS